MSNPDIEKQNEEMELKIHIHSAFTKRREELIAGLRELANFLESNTEIETPGRVEASIYGLDNKEAFLALVSDTSFCVTPCGSDHVKATKLFSGRVELFSIIPHDKLVPAMKRPSVEEILQQAKQRPA